MKNSAKLLLLALAVSMVVACGKETKAEETKKPDSQRTEVQVQEPKEETKVEAPTVKVLGKAYADYLEKVAGECYTPEELAFATADKYWQRLFELEWMSLCEKSKAIAALIVDDEGNIISEGRNKIGENGIPNPRVQHAEVEAIRNLDISKYPFVKTYEKISGYVSFICCISFTLVSVSSAVVNIIM